MFWSHGGNSGTIETVHCGKPAIITPFYGDQYLNAAALEERGMGFMLPLLEITADRIFKTVDKALNSRYEFDYSTYAPWKHSIIPYLWLLNHIFSHRAYEAAQKVSYEHRNRLASPVDTAIWWIEHVIATGGYTLGKVNTHDLHWISYYSIDTVAILIFVTSSFIWIFKRILGALFCSKTHTAKVKKQ